MQLITYSITRDQLVPRCRALKSEGFDLFVDLCGVDHQARRPERFEVVIHLAKLGEHVCLKVPVAENDPTLPSLTGIWRGANWFERECFDLFGIKFEGHPNLKRLLLYEGFEGHPLRKDYPKAKRQKIPEPVDLAADLERDGCVFVNLGPSHPATHGTFRVMLKLDGERIVEAVPEIGYLHRCFEKEAEDHTYTQVIPYTDRLNYCSSLMNNVGYCMAVEQLMGIEIPERAKYIRILIAELSRIIDHLVAIGANMVDMGALTNFWYAFNVREEINDWIEALCGARLTTAYTRIGGVARDLPMNTARHLRSAMKKLSRAISDVTGLLVKNRIFLDRARGVGAISAADAVSYGFTGPCLRAAGVAYDLRKDVPYYHYNDLDFDVPVGEHGDTYDRVMIRFEEMRQSARIVEQVLSKITKGPIMADDHSVAMPAKADVYSSIEAMMNHFKLVMDGITPPKGEIYSATEAANGELGFYIVSDGSARPYRIKVRPPCFAIYQAFPALVKGHMIADAVAILGSLNVIAGELDR
jgi:NADH-quinone oxidoreductase subunit C/D